MVTQQQRTIENEPTTPYNSAVEYIINYYEGIGCYKLKVSRNQILDDYINRKKTIFTSVIPVYDSPYDEEAIKFAMSLGWNFKFCYRIYPEYEQFYFDRARINSWALHCTWDTVYPLGIKDQIVQRNEKGEITAFIGYRLDEVCDMHAADYSGTCVDSAEYTKMCCDFVSDRSFNNFAFSDLVMAMIDRDINNFLRTDEAKEKYFEKV